MLTHGVPAMIVSYNGPAFVSAEFQQFCLDRTELNMAHTSCAISPVIEWLGRKGCAHCQTGTQPSETWETPVGAFNKVFSLHIGFLLIQRLAMPYQSC